MSQILYEPILLYRKATSLILNVLLKRSGLLAQSGLCYFHVTKSLIKKLFLYTVYKWPLLRLLANFRCPPSEFYKISNAPPPLQNPESKEYNPEFSLIIDTICSSSRCLIYSSMCFSSTKIPTCCFFHLTSARWNGTVFKKIF